MKTEQRDWSAYATGRNLSRNRLLLPWHAEMIDDYLRVFHRLPPDKRVLDIGPATGLFMVFLRELGFLEVDGLEISPVYKEVIESKGLDVYLGDIVSGEGLEQLRPPYDAVQMMEVLEHLHEPGKALDHVHALLAPGGFLYATVPISDSIFERLHRLRRGKTRRDMVMEIDETHVQAFDPATLSQLLSAHGFQVREIRRLSFRPPGFVQRRYFPGYRLQLFLRSLLPHRWRGTCISVVADRAG